MEIDETINKWFEETSIQIENKVRTGTKVDLLLVCSLIAARNYSNAVFLLLRSGHKMPAKALLRVLCELLVKVLWCLHAPDTLKGSKDEFITQKIRQWIKTTLRLNAMIVEEIKGAATNEEKVKLDDMLKGLLNDADKIKVKEMPNLKEIFKQLPDPWKVKQRAMLYLQFNNAVHLDPKSLGDLVKRNDKGFHYLHDSKDNVNELTEYHVIYACNFNTLVRYHYNWDIKQMNEEYENIVRRLSKKS